MTDAIKELENLVGDLNEIATLSEKAAKALQNRWIKVKSQPVALTLRK